MACVGISQIDDHLADIPEYVVKNTLLHNTQLLFVAGNRIPGGGYILGGFWNYGVPAGMNESTAIEKISIRLINLSQRYSGVNKVLFALAPLRDKSSDFYSVNVLDDEGQWEHKATKLTLPIFDLQSLATSYFFAQRRLATRTTSTSLPSLTRYCFNVLSGENFSHLILNFTHFHESQNNVIDEM